jgi:hypothetical protein
MKARPAQCRAKLHDHGSGAGGRWRDKSEGAATPQPFMILKDFPEGVWKILQDHGSTAGGAAKFL